MLLHHQFLITRVLPVIVNRAMMAVVNMLLPEPWERRRRLTLTLPRLPTVDHAMPLATISRMVALIIPVS